MDHKWSIPDGGFRWVGSKGKERLVPMRENGNYNTYTVPVDLYAKFSEIEPSKDGIQRFANKYGRLGLQFPADEVLRRWLEERAAVEAVLKLYRGELNPEWESVPKPGTDFHGIWIIRWRIAGIQSEPGEPYDQAQGLCSARETLKKTNCQIGTKRLLASIISKHLSDQVGTWLEYKASPILGQDDFELRQGPRNLLAMIWLQLADLVRRGKRNTRTCTECLTRFDVAPGIHRRDTRFCSEACRCKAWRRRTNYKRPNRR